MKQRTRVTLSTGLATKPTAHVPDAGPDLGGRVLRQRGWPHDVC